jgi:hypothetical protein
MLEERSDAALFVGYIIYFSLFIWGDGILAIVNKFFAKKGNFLMLLVV